MWYRRDDGALNLVLILVLVIVLVIVIGGGVVVVGNRGGSDTNSGANAPVATPHR